MNSFVYGVIAITVAVLLPIVPAYLLFKLLPSNAVVAGPLKGLTVNLGGAFGGYFAILLLLLWRMPSPPSDTEYYTLEGRLVLPDASVEPRFREGALTMRVMPPEQEFYSDGRFRARFPFDPQRTDRAPTIMIDAGKCGHANIPITLDRQTSGFGIDYDLRLIPAQRRIIARRPVKLVVPPLLRADQVAAELCGRMK